MAPFFRVPLNRSGTINRQMAEKATGYYASDSNKLPASEEVNIAALSRLFENTTNSYKYVFFISILDILQRRRFDVSQPIAFEELVVEMLANAWYPHTYFRLSFGTQDQIAKILDSLPLEIQEPILQFTDTDKELLRKSIQSQNLEEIIKKLQRFVPFRLITPFLEQELQGVKNRVKGDKLDRAVPRAAENCFDEYKPLYRFNSDQYSACNSIIFHPSWANYFKIHYRVIRGWAAWEWLNYMQKRNPATPGLVHKLFAPNRREPLLQQNSYWKMVLNHVDFYCIYSGQKIDANRFSLDHYLPWSFVAHNQLWNLVPTTPEVNSSKSNYLPPDRVFDKFVTAQHQGLVTCHEHLPHDRWNKTVEAYINDLRIQSQDDLLDLETLRNAYSNAVQPLISLAANQGFKLWQSSYIDLS